jgi:hypothetical protein
MLFDKFETGPKGTACGCTSVMSVRLNSTEPVLCKIKCAEHALERMTVEIPFNEDMNF